MGGRRAVYGTPAGIYQDDDDDIDDDFNWDSLIAKDTNELSCAV